MYCCKYVPGMYFVRMPKPFILAAPAVAAVGCAQLINADCCCCRCCPLPLFALASVGLARTKWFIGAAFTLCVVRCFFFVARRYRKRVSCEGEGIDEGLSPEDHA